MTEGSEPVKYESLNARMHAMDDTKSFGELPFQDIARTQDQLYFSELQLRAIDTKVLKLPGENLRTFLMSQLTGILKGCQPKNIHQLCDLYERARFSPDGFSTKELEAYKELLAHIVQM